MKIRNIGLFVSIIMLVGCTSGGGTSTLGGVAAVGAPITGGTITVNCAMGSPLSATTGATGGWQVTLAGHSLPCAVQVAGGMIGGIPNAVPYHSIATVAGTVNITPLTDLLVANLAGTNPSTWFNGAPVQLAGINQGKVDESLGKLQTALGLPSGLNPVTTSFSAIPGNAMDDMLEALKAAMTNASVTYAALLNNAMLSGFTAPVGLADAFQTACEASASLCIPTVDSGTGGGAGGGNGTLPVGVSGQVVNMVYSSAGAGSPYANDDEVLFTFSSSGMLTLTEQYTVVANSFVLRGNEYIWTDSPHSREYALSVLNGAIHEVNVTGLNGTPFYGQFSPVSGGSSGSGGAGGNYTLVVSVTAGGISVEGMTLNNVPKPANQNDFCEDVSVQNALDGVATGGTLTIDSCTFNGTTGSISAMLNLTTPVEMSVPYVANYTYSASGR